MKDIFKYYICEKCGGELKNIEGGHFKCPYCRMDFFMEITLPEGLVIDLHNAAMDRSVQRFEDALNKYDVIISKYPDKHDAYWGAVLSDYGVQYEKDYDGKMVPTVHRFSEISVFENDYYENAIKYCTMDAERSRMEESAAEIEKIRAEIKKAVGAQTPYDIFLCYKETPIGASEGYTPEFYWADELYRRLKGDGYKVFFAKESLASAKGDYEAHIFPALRSSKLMLILTSSVENVESVWVKNEWSRFIRFARENGGEGKRFKVIQSGIRPEKLPRELRKEQALNHDSMGWVEQLYDVIKDTFRDKEKEEAERKQREKEDQAAEFARMLEEERERWAADERKKRDDEERRKREEADRRSRENAERLERASEETRVKIGESITLGAYPQDRSGNKADIKWLVLDTCDGKALVVSKRAIDCKEYNAEQTDVTWESCSLRAWLNGEFLSKAFSEEEIKVISEVTLEDIPFDDDEAVDKVFLLSTAEVEKCFSTDKDKACKSTGYAAVTGAYVDKDSGNTEWWLRTSGAVPGYAVSVSCPGVINYYGTKVSNGHTAVRPAMWIDLDEMFGAPDYDTENEAVPVEPEIENGYVEKQLENGFYKGYVVNGLPHGKGIITYKSGDVYEGDFVRGLSEGIGKYTFSHGSIHEGAFKNDVRHGKGKLTYKNGDVFVGVWNGSQAKGKMTYANGKKARGKMKKGVFKKNLFFFF